MTAAPPEAKARGAAFRFDDSQWASGPGPADGSCPDCGPAQGRRFDRRRVLGAAVALPAAFVAACGRERMQENERRLGLYNVNTRESLDIVYWSDGAYREDALRRIDRIMRDRRTEQVAPIDVRLLDTLARLHWTSGSSEPFQVVSAYRSRASNEARLRAGAGVASNSYHSRGMAADVALPDISVARLYDAALAMRAGGVGYYPDSGFVHVDTGPVRDWQA